MSETDIESYKRLNNFSIQRKMIKKSIMTIPYNATNPKLIECVKEDFDSYYENNEQWFVFKENPNLKLKYNDIYLLVKGIREILATNFPILINLMKYLKQVATICTKLNIYIPWTLPSGLVVKQSYLAQTSVRITPFSYSKSSFTLRINCDEFNRHKQIRAFMIHVKLTKITFSW